MKMTKIRGFIAGAFALALVAVLIAFAGAAMGTRVPVVGIVTDIAGMTSPPR